MAIEANVRWSMSQILQTQEGQNAIRAGAKLVGAIYEIASGHGAIALLTFAMRPGGV